MSARASRGGDTGVRLALVTDDAPLRSLLEGLLGAHGYGYVASVDTRGAVSRRFPEGVHVAIVDASARCADALRAARRLKAAGAAVVAIVAKENGTLAPHELAASGDVLIGKPFDPRELLLVVRGMLDLHGDAAPQGSATLAVGAIGLNAELNTATVGAREIELTDTETRILRELLLAGGAPVDRERLMRQALQRRWSPDDRALDTHINRLRAKLGRDPRGRTPIRTVRGVGYRLVAEWEPR